MPSVKRVEKYLEQVLQKKNVHVSYFGRLDEYDPAATKGKKTKKHQAERSSSIKSLGYGIPYLVVYAVGNGPKRESIISTMRIGKGFGHDFRSDRVENAVASFDTWNSLPEHCKAQDFGAFSSVDSSPISLGKSGEFFILREKVSGVEYHKDLDRIFSSGSLEENDIGRSTALAGYLARIHSKKKQNEPEIYARKIRDTVGHGECIFGLTDSYPEGRLEYLDARELEFFEKLCVQHRWKLKNRFNRLCQVHGDFHPWNILFSSNPRTPLKFKLLDRSRGEWGEPADDVCALSMNYVFYSLRKYGKLTRPFESLFTNFMDTYMEQTKDEEMFEAMPLFYSFRALVIASPMWYPSLSIETRRQIFNFAENSLISGRFDPRKVNDYIQSKPILK